MKLRKLFVYRKVEITMEELKKDDLFSLEPADKTDIYVDAADIFIAEENPALSPVPGRSCVRSTEMIRKQEARSLAHFVCIHCGNQEGDTVELSTQLEHMKKSRDRWMEVSKELQPDGPIWIKLDSCGKEVGRQRDQLAIAVETLEFIKTLLQGPEWNAPETLTHIEVRVGDALAKFKAGA